MEQLVASLRALAISRKDPTSLKDLLEDYVEFEGRPVEVRKYGFKTIEDFLQASGEFVLTKKHGQTYLIPRASKFTAHITKMVQKQKTKRSKKTCKVYSASIRFDTETTRQTKRKRTSGDHRRLSNSSTISESSSSVSPVSRSSTPPPPSWVSSSSSRYSPWNRDPSPPRQRTSSRQSSTRQRSSPSNSYPSISGSAGYQYVSHQPPPDNSNCWNFFQETWPDSTFNDFHRNFPEPIVSYNDIEIAVALEVYAAFSGLPSPTYNVYTLPGYRGFMCALLVDTICCSTQPASYDTPLRAKIECAYIALQILHSNNMLRLYPVHRGDRGMLLRNLAEEVRKNSGGVASHMIPALYRNRYGESLPNNWMTLVKQSRLFTMRASNRGEVLISVNIL